MRCALAVLVVVVSACEQREPAPAPDVTAERAMNDELYRLEHQAKEISVALELLDKQLEAAVKDLENAQSDEERTRMRAVMDKLAADKAALDRRVEALDAAVKARAGAGKTTD